MQPQRIDRPTAWARRAIPVTSLAGLVSVSPCTLSDAGRVLEVIR